LGEGALGLGEGALGLGEGALGLGEGVLGLHTNKCEDALNRRTVHQYV